jgi:hypothetical protein
MQRARAAVRAHGSKVCDALAAPSIAQKPPTGHGEHASASSFSVYEPGGHAAQVAPLKPVRLLKRPGPQMMQLSLEAARVAGMRVPAGHGVPSLSPVVPQ